MANMEEVEQALKKMEADYKYYKKLLDNNEFVINLPIGGEYSFHAFLIALKEVKEDLQPSYSRYKMQ